MSPLWRKSWHLRCNLSAPLLTWVHMDLVDLYDNAKILSKPLEVKVVASVQQNVASFDCSKAVKLDHPERKLSSRMI